VDFGRLDRWVVQPGLICSKVWRHPLSFSTMESTVAVLSELILREPLPIPGVFGDNNVGTVQNGISRMFMAGQLLARCIRRSER